MRKRVLPYLSGRLFDGISSGMFMMALPWIMLNEPGMGTFVAILALVCTGASFVSTLFMATLIDRFSRKKLLVLMQVVQASTALCVLLAYWYGVESIWLLAFAQLVFWLSGDMAWSTNNAFVHENFNPNEYAKISSYDEVVMQTSVLGAGALGIVVLEMWSMVEFAFLATLASSFAALSYLITPYRRQLSTRIKESYLSQLVESKSIFSKDPAFYAFIALSCLSYPVLTFLVKLVPIYFSEQGVEGSWFATWKMSYGVGALICGLVVAKLLTRFNPDKSMLFSIFIMSILLLGIGVFLSPIIMVTLTVIIGFFNAFNRISRINKLHHMVAISERGRVDGGLKLFSTLSQSLSYLLIAWLTANELTSYGFMIIAGVMMSAAMMMWLLIQKRENGVMVLS
ncbi:MFS transporter [Vibrio sp. DW001]|uniref:MFS transporter n=1 Tax=Vibrio sp. DW001 TaxID=2912315 RepID=UPI0023B13A10|nr:MFS transporter [Vibrio sp. DW001]WED29464.1 MFS transporter [Vibrio sp. DW001]